MKVFKKQSPIQKYIKPTCIADISTSQYRFQRYCRCFVGSYASLAFEYILYELHYRSCIYNRWLKSSKILFNQIICNNKSNYWLGCVKFFFWKYENGEVTMFAKLPQNNVINISDLPLNFFNLKKWLKVENNFLIILLNVK